MKKNSIPFCMMPFIANMMGGKPENSESSKGDPAFIQWFNSIADSMLFRTYDNGILDLIFANSINHEEFTKDVLEQKAVEDNMMSSLIKNSPFSISIHVAGEGTVVDKGGGRVTQSGDVTYTLNESLETYGTSLIAGDPISGITMRGEASGIYNENVGPEEPYSVEGINALEKLTDMLLTMSQPDSDWEVTAVATVTFASGEVFTTNLCYFIVTLGL